MKSTRRKSLFVVILAFLSALSVVNASAQNQVYTPYSIVSMTSNGDSGGGTGLFVLYGYGMAIYKNTNIYVTSYNNHAIWKFWSTNNGANWSQVLFAGSGSVNGSGSQDGVGTGARFTYPNQCVVDSQGNLFVADTGNYTLRKITPDGTVTTVAGKLGHNDFADGVGTNAGFKSMSGMTIDANDTIYFGDYGSNRFRKITIPGYAVSTVALATTSYAEWGGALCMGADGNIYQANSVLHVIRKITPGGAVSVVAGTMLSATNIDGTNLNARFNVPNGIGADALGNLYVSDGGSATIRKMTKIGDDWVVRTIAGFTGAIGSSDGTGASARFNVPGTIVVADNGKVYISDVNSGGPNGGRIRVAKPNAVNRWTNSTNGKWEETNRWFAGVPSLSNTADYITNNLTKIVLIDANTVVSNPASMTINNLILRSPNAASTNFLVMLNAGTANPLKVTERFLVDSGGVVALTNSAVQTTAFGIGVTNGNAFMNIVGGSTVSDTVGVVGLEDGGLNGAVVTGAGSTWVNSQSFTAGYYSGNTNGVFVQNGGFIGSGTVSIGEGCDGNLLAVSGVGSSINSLQSLRVGWDFGNGNSLVITSNATVAVGADGMDIGDGGDNNSVSVTEAGSTLTSAGPIRLLGGSGPEGNALLIGVGGKVIAPSVVVSNGSFVALNAGTLETGGTIVDNGLPFYVGVATDPTTLRLTGGTHTFKLGLGITTGASLTGCATLIDSYLTVIDAGGTVALDSGCQLTFSGNLTNRGTLNADTTLTVATNYAQTASGKLHVDIGGTNAGVFGKLNVGGSATVGGTLDVTFNNFAPALNTQITILSAGSRSGTFANFTYPTNLVGLRLDYTPTAVIVVVTNAPVSITPTIMAPPTISNGQFGATFAGKPSATYVIEYSDGMTPPDWHQLTQLVATPSGGFSFLDPAAQPSRYYRARYLSD